MKFWFLVYCHSTDFETNVPRKSVTNIKNGFEAYKQMLWFTTVWVSTIKTKGGKMYKGRCWIRVIVASQKICARISRFLFSLILTLLSVQNKVVSMWNFMGLVVSTGSTYGVLSIQSSPKYTVVQLSKFIYDVRLLSSYIFEETSRFRHRTIRRMIYQPVRHLKTVRHRRIAPQASKKKEC
jgi:hypothetical protein